MFTGDLAITEPGILEKPALGVTRDLHPPLPLAPHLFRGQHILFPEGDDGISLKRWHGVSR